MTKDIGNQMLGHLNSLRAGLDRIEAETKEVKMRLTSLEERLTLVEK